MHLYLLNNALTNECWTNFIFNQSVYQNIYHYYSINMQNIISVNNEVEYMEKYYKLVNIVERYLFNNCFNRNNIKIK